MSCSPVHHGGHGNATPPEVLTSASPGCGAFTAISGLRWHPVHQNAGAHCWHSSPHRHAHGADPSIPKVAACCAAKAASRRDELFQPPWPLRGAGSLRHSMSAAFSLFRGPGRAHRPDLPRRAGHRAVVLVHGEIIDGKTAGHRRAHRPVVQRLAGHFVNWRRSQPVVQQERRSLRPAEHVHIAAIHGPQASSPLRAATSRIRGCALV